MKDHGSPMNTSVVAGIPRNCIAASIITTIIGSFGGTRSGGYLLVRAGGGKQHGTGDSVLTGSHDVLLGHGDPVPR